MPTNSLPSAPATPFDQITLVLGFVMPLVIALIQQTHWSTAFKTFVAFMACLAAAAARCLVEATFTPGNVLGNSLALLAMTVTLFHGFWKPLTVAGWLEQVTSFKPPVDDVLPEKYLKDEYGDRR